LGLTRYYKIFIENYAEKVAPLTTLSKTDIFRWNGVVDACFKNMETVMTSTSFLATLELIKTFVLKFNVS
jgi:hypothetical protein